MVVPTMHDAVGPAWATHQRKLAAECGRPCCACEHEPWPAQLRELAVLRAIKARGGILGAGKPLTGNMFPLDIAAPDTDDSVKAKLRDTLTSDAEALDLAGIARLSSVLDVVSTARARVGRPQPNPL